ncbi:MAG: methyltransferase domain-containing protein [Acidimicrobiales bacterium]
MSGVACRSCEASLGRTVFDLGCMPLANEYPSTEVECLSEQRYPLRVRLCERCWLLQLDEVIPPDRLFSDYAYFSSYSDTWVSQAAEFAGAMQERLQLGSGSLVLEVASNDGYLLRHFVRRGVPVLGIDPAENVVASAVASGVPTKVGFFGSELAAQLVIDGVAADLVVANNVLAHVPDTNDFVAGLVRVLAPEGILSVEFPELSTMLAGAQFDQIYHEHVFYFSLLSCESLLRRHGLRVVDVVSLASHGGSLRVMACHDDAAHVEEESVNAVRRRELQLGLGTVDPYSTFAAGADSRAESVRRWLEGVAARGKRVAAYGAAAKGNTLLNYCSVTTGDIGYVVDRSPHKQGHFLPGSHLPILPPGALVSGRPDFVLVLAWNLLDEVTASLPEVRAWGGRFVTTMPTLTVVQ